MQCPRQLGGVECGYYVMKFMKHFVQDPYESINTKVKEIVIFNSKQCYWLLKKIYCVVTYNIFLLIVDEKAE